MLKNMLIEFPAKNLKPRILFLVIPLLLGAEFALGVGLLFNLYIPVAFVFLLTLTTVIIIQPKVGLLGVVILVPLVNLTFFGVGLSIYEPLFPVFGLTVIAWVLTKHLPPLPRAPFLIPFILLIGWSMVGLFWTPDVGSGFFSCVKLLFCLCLVYFFLSTIDSWKYLSTVLWVWWAGAVANCMLSIILNKHSYVPEWDMYEPDRWCGVFTLLPNAYALYIIISLFFTLALISITESRSKKVVLALSIPLMLVMLGLTGSRGGMVSFAIGIVTTIFAMKRKLIALLGVIIFIAMIVSLLFMGADIPGVNRLKDLVSPENTTVTMRLVFWGYALNLLSRSWGFGVGPSGFNSLGPVEYGSAFSGAHNIFFSILADYGLIGFTLFIIFIIQIFRYLSIYAHKLRNTPYWHFLIFFACGLFTIFLHTNFEDINLDFRVIWAFIGIGFAPMFFKLSEQDKALG